MSHVRTQIKKAALAALQANGVLQSICHMDRDVEFDITDLPAVNVHNIGGVETNTRLSMGKPARCSRTMQLFVDCLARYSTNVSSGVDDLTAQVEMALLSSPNGFLDPLIQSIVLSSTGTDKSSDAGGPIARARLVFEVTYHVKDGLPEVAI